MSLVPVRELRPDAPVLAQIHALKRERERRMKAAAAKLATQHKQDEKTAEAARTWFQIYAEMREQRRIEEALAAKERWRESWRNMCRLIILADAPRKSLKDIILEVCAKYGVSPIEIESARRQQWIMQPRYEVYWRARRETTLSLPHIGRLVGGRDHTTILHGINTYEEWRAMKAGKIPVKNVGGHRDFSKIIGDGE